MGSQTVEWCVVLPGFFSSGPASSVLFFPLLERLDYIPPPFPAKEMLAHWCYVLRIMQYYTVRNWANLTLWLVLYNYDPSSQISQVVRQGSIIHFIKYRMR